MATAAGTILRVLSAARSPSVRTLRETCGWLLTGFGLLVMFGLAWDSTWHSSVGRDKGFLSPPHLLMYVSAAGAGLVAILSITAESIRFHARGDVHPGNSVSVLRIFRAPIGIFLAGFGIFTMVIAGPLDNYWHSLYGIFVHPWKPFHMMGILGGAIWGVGNLYLWSALIVESRRVPLLDGRVASWGLVAGATALLRLMMTIAYPGLSLFQTADLGPLRIMIYPIMLPLVTIWLLVAAGVALGRRWPAATIAAALLGFHVVIQAAVPWIVRLQAGAEARTFFNATLVPSFDPVRLAPDLGLLLAAVVLDLWLRRRPIVALALWGQTPRGQTPRPDRPAWLGAAAIAGTFWGVGTVTALMAAQTMARMQLPPALHPRPMASPADMLLTLPLALIAGMLSARVGLGLAEILSRNPR